MQWDESATCSSQSVTNLRVKIDTGCPASSSAIGTTGNGSPNNIYMHVCSVVQPVELRRKTVMFGAAHEFGHALSFLHEQNRPEVTPEMCAADGHGAGGGDLEIGEFDLTSLMDYCNPYSASQGYAVHTSAGDVWGAGMEYASAFPFSAISQASGDVELFRRLRTPHKMSARKFTGGSWVSDTKIGTTEDPSSAPVAVATSATRTDAFWRSPTGTLSQITRTGTTLSAIANLGTPPTGAIIGEPVAVARSSSQLTVLVRTENLGKDGLAVREWDGSTWGAWTDLAVSATDVFGRPSVVVSQDGSVNVFVTWFDQSIKTMRSTALGVWPASWTDLGGGVVGSPASVALKNSLNSTDLFVFVRGSAGGLFYKRMGRGTLVWDTNWTYLAAPPGVTWTASPSVISRSNEILDVYINDYNGNTWSIARQTSGMWSSWLSLPTAGGSVTGSPQAIATSPTHIHVFILSDGVAGTRDIQWDPSTSWTIDNYHVWLERPAF